jgi:hypothetical protein
VQVKVFKMSDLIAKWEARAAHYKDNVEHARSYDTAVRSAKFQELVEEFVVDLKGADGLIREWTTDE